VRGFLKPGQTVDKRRFSASIGTGYKQELALFYSETDILEKKIPGSSLHIDIFNLDY
jgi:hypothetical protein